MAESTYFDQLKKKMDTYAHVVYKISKKFPKDELYGVTSQIRRAALSVILNYIEGFARQGKPTKRHFWEIAYGSLKESKYLLHFCLTENYMEKEDYLQALQLSEEIGAMLWRAIESLS